MLIKTKTDENAHNVCSIKAKEKRAGNVTKYIFRLTLSAFFRASLWNILLNFFWFFYWFTRLNKKIQD
jgi:hypothetical protein